MRGGTELVRRRKVGVLLPAREVGGGFAIGAREAVERVRAAGHDLDVREGVTGAPDPSWGAVLCHGGQLTGWLRDHPSRPAVLTDHPSDTSGLEGVTLVDWCWDQAARLAGALAADLAGGQPIGLLAGPAVLTQRRVAAAYVDGAAEAGHAGDVVVVHVPAFDDVPAGERMGRLLGETAGCAVVAHAADSAGEAGCAVARAAGARTIGFVEPLGLHVATVDSDVAGVVQRLLTALATGERLPDVYEAGLDSGHLGLTVAPTL